jgi:hypothetical protein
MPSRREFVAGAAGFFLSALPALPLLEIAKQQITVYKSQSCGCCTLWIEHIQANGFVAQVHNEESMDELKDTLGVPQSVRSCHTAIVGKYLIEGHVPAEDIRRLLTEKPKVLGLAVPGMPPGTPGMAKSKAESGGYTVISFQSGGSPRTFAEH